MTEMSTLRASEGERVRVVGTSRYDEIELSSQPFPSREEAEAFIERNGDDEVVAYAIEGGTNE